MTKQLTIFICLLLLPLFLFSQKPEDKRWLSIDRIYESGDFQMDHFGQARWMENGEAYTTLEKSEKYKNFILSNYSDTKFEKDCTLYSTSTLAAEKILEKVDRDISITSITSWSESFEKKESKEFAANYGCISPF